MGYKDVKIIKEQMQMARNIWKIFKISIKEGTTI